MRVPMPMNQGIVLKPEGCPTIPDQHKQKFYRSFVAKLQFAATWIRFDISFAVYQLARYCAAAGKACYAASDIRSIGEQSGRTTGRLGFTGLQSVPSEGRHSWHSGAHPPLPSSPGRVTLSE